ncbi:hypothetical protein BKA63DRAFT_58190 [Paraphoma chrysanthemicola]|nr:hypothetical protein BKA63DRAFT_58190 [Paraphoma chrysanthemicola]
MDENSNSLEDGLQTPLLRHGTDGKPPSQPHRKAWTSHLATFIWQNRWLVPLLATILVAGVLLWIQASKGDVSIFLLMLFAWGMILLAILARLVNRPADY